MRTLLKMRTPLKWELLISAIRSESDGSYTNALFTGLLSEIRKKKEKLKAICSRVFEFCPHKHPSPIGASLSFSSRSLLLSLPLKFSASLSLPPSSAYSASSASASCNPPPLPHRRLTILIEILSAPISARPWSQRWSVPPSPVRSVQFSDLNLWLVRIFNFSSNLPKLRF